MNEVKDQLPPRPVVSAAYEAQGRADILVEAPSGIRFKFNQEDADSYLKGVPGSRIITPEMLADEKARARGEAAEA